MTHPYAHNCCALPASHEVHDWLGIEKSKRVTAAFANAVALRPELTDEFLADCIMEAAK